MIQSSEEGRTLKAEGAVSRRQEQVQYLRNRKISSVSRLQRKTKSKKPEMRLQRKVKMR